MILTLIVKDSQGNTGEVAVVRSTVQTFQTLIVKDSQGNDIRLRISQIVSIIVSNPYRQRQSGKSYDITYPYIIKERFKPLSSKTVREIS